MIKLDRHVRHQIGSVLNGKQQGSNLKRREEEEIEKMKKKVMR